MTSGAAEIPRRRGYGGPAILDGGFRPFFLAAGLWGVTAMVVWTFAMHGDIGWAAAFDPLRWHVHEMLFGYVAAVLAGFILTAVPNWTGRLPIRGTPLLLLVLLWVAGRIAVFAGAAIGAGLTAAIDLSFLLVLFTVLLREILAGSNWRNLPVVAAILLLLTATALMHADLLALLPTADLGMRLAVAIVVMLIALIGGRIVPSFTRNWLAKRGDGPLPAPFGLPDRAALLAAAAALGAWVALPQHAAAAGLAGLAALLHAVRLARWQGYRTAAEPLVWVLHAGYAWIPLGFALLALSHWWAALPQSAALHAFTAGAMGTMPLAVMTRAILGHTGRDLHAGAGTVAIYLLIILAAAARIVGPLFPDLFTLSIMVGGGAWIAAFAVFVALYGPMLLRRRPARG